MKPLFPPAGQSIALALISAMLVPCDAALADAKPLKVFLLVGQSNMQGHAHVRTFPHIAMDEETAPLLEAIQDESGKPRVCENVWITYLSSEGEKHGRLTAGFGADENKIGPELTFGIFAEQMLGGPILLIKTAWGGKSLHTDFRPPGAGAYQFNQSQLEALEKQGKDIDEARAERAEVTGMYYRQAIDHVQSVLGDIKRVYPDYDPDAGFTLEGLVWFQGWNDMVDRGTYPDRGNPGGYDSYSALLAQFIRDVRKDLSAPDLPVVVGVMGAGGPVDKYLPDQQRYKGIHQNFRQAMAAPGKLPEFRGNVRNVFTEQFWDMQLVDLRARDAKIKQQIKKLRNDGELSKDDERAMLEKMRNDVFSAEELKALETGVSNFEFHYLGSAKIMTQIGRGFAAAMVELVEPEKKKP